jgi:hypothetical protein
MDIFILLAKSSEMGLGICPICQIVAQTGGTRGGQSSSKTTMIAADRHPTPFSQEQRTYLITNSLINSQKQTGNHHPAAARQIHQTTSSPARNAGARIRSQPLSEYDV